MRSTGEAMCHFKVTISVAVLLVFFLLVPGHGFSVAVTNPPDSSEVRSILGVDDGGEKAYRIIDAFAKSIEDRSAEARLSAAVADLADALNLGVDAVQLTARSASFVSVEHILGDSTEGASWHSATIDLSRELSRQAKAHPPGTPEGDRYARAALVLASADRMTLVDLVLAAMLLDRELLSRLNLSAESRSELTRVGKEMVAAREAVRPHYWQTSQDLKALIAAPKSQEVWDAHVPSLLRHLREGWPLAAGQLKIRLFLAGDAWRLLCLARANGRNDVVKQVEAVVNELKAITVDDPIAMAWLEQVLTKRGAAPKAPTIRIIKSPNDMKPRTP